MTNSWWHNHITGKAGADRAERADRAGQYKVNYLTLCLWISMPYTSKNFSALFSYALTRGLFTRSILQSGFTLRFRRLFDPKNTQGSDIILECDFKGQRKQIGYQNARQNRTVKLFV
jgi:hypothetical protein